MLLQDRATLTRRIVSRRRACRVAATEYLPLLACKCRIEALLRGRLWYATRRAVETYRRFLEDR